MEWKAQPPANHSLPHLPLLRVKTAETIRGAITCLQIEGTDTHFMSNRTLPCIGEECGGCAQQLATRWEGYISVWTTQGKHIITSLTPRAANNLLGTVADPCNLRGLFVTIERQGRRPNSPLNARCEQPDVLTVKLPPLPNLRAHLCRIWGLALGPEQLDDETISAELKRTYAKR